MPARTMKNACRVTTQRKARGCRIILAARARSAHETASHATCPRSKSPACTRHSPIIASASRRKMRRIPINLMPLDSPDADRITKLLGDDQRIYDVNRTEDLSILEILGVENIGAAHLRRVNNQCIPEGNLVSRFEAERGEDRFARVHDNLPVRISLDPLPQVLDR